MSFKYVILNLLLLFVVVMVSIENYETWTQPIGLVPNHQETLKKSAAKAEIPPAVGTNKEPASLRSFILISEKNIFSPERKDFPILTVEKSNPATRPHVILYGITIAGDFQAASLVNPGRPLRKGERETMTVKIGEKIGEYKLAKVLPDRIALENNGDVFEVLLYDSKNPKKRTEVKTENKPATVNSSQQSPQPTPVPTQGQEPKPTPPRESVEKPKEPVQQQITPPPPSTRPPRPSFPQIDFRRGRRTLYPPPAGTSSQTTEQN